MNKISLFVLLILFIGIAGYTSGMFYVVVHEKAHVAVFTKYGIDSIVTLNPKMIDGATIPNETQYIEKCNDFCKSDQMNIEAVGYHTALLIFAGYLLASALMGFYILFVREYGYK